MKIFGSRHLRPENILHLGPSNIQHLRPENILHLSPARLRTVPPPSLTVNSSPLPPFLDHQVTRMIINECYNKSQDINAVSPFWTSRAKLFFRNSKISKYSLPVPLLQLVEHASPSSSAS